eukprot:gene1277-8258_t
MVRGAAAAAEGGSGGGAPAAGAAVPEGKRRPFPRMEQAAVDVACATSLRMLRAGAPAEVLRMTVREAVRAAVWGVTHAGANDDAQPPDRRNSKAAARRARRAARKQQQKEQQDAPNPAHREGDVPEGARGTPLEEENDGELGAGDGEPGYSGDEGLDGTYEGVWDDDDELQYDGGRPGVGGGGGASSVDAMPIKMGTRVRITGLVAAKELNDVEGQVCRGIKKGRWGVELDGGRGERALKPGNIIVLRGAANSPRPNVPQPAAGPAPPAAGWRRLSGGYNCNGGVDPLRTLARPAGTETAAVMDESPFLHLLNLPHLLQMLGLELFFCLASTG